MKFKSSYLVILMSLFMIFVFLDQNRTPVPIKILFGNPYHFGLSLIIIISLLVGAITTMAVVYLTNRKNDG